MKAFEDEQRLEWFFTSKLTIKEKKLFKHKYWINLFREPIWGFITPS